MFQTNILIVAYNRAFGQALATMLSPQTYAPTLITRGAEAHSHLQEGRVDLCLMQDRLPDCSGLDLCEQLRQNLTPHDTPIILFSHQAAIEKVAQQKGACGFVKLPCRPHTLRDLVATSVGRKKTILLVDDSRVIHSIVEDILQDEDFELLHAFDGEEGYQQALAVVPDLIISDIDMPKMDGFAFCQRVKETAATEHIPVIMQSTRGSGLDIDKGFDAGANDYLTKPVNPDELLSRIQQILGRDQKRARERILVVDDSKTIRNFMQQGLAQQGFEVVTAADGQEGLAAAVQKKPDLIVTDLEMPLMNGRELTRELKKQDMFKNTPVIMLTASGSQRDELKGRHAGVDAYLSKPFAPDKLVVLVEKLIAERKLLAERGELQNRNQYIREVFGRYMTEDVVKTLLDSSEGLQLGGERRQVTIMMSDLRGFTSLAERLSPEEVVSMLNVYLEAMTSVIVKYGGTIDEFIGDAILTIFGAPIMKEDDAQRAVACAVEMQLAMQAVNAWNRHNGFPDIEMGIGINTGEVVVGNIGSKKRAKYGIVGSPINMTARIESYTVGGQILISEETLQHTSEMVQVGRHLEIEPKGAKKPMTIYDVTGIAGPYNIFLPSHDEVLTPLEVEIPIAYTVLEEKFAGRTLFTGRIARLSTREALIVSQAPQAALSNLKMQLHDPDSAEVFNEVYGKVMELSQDDDQQFYVRFTSMSKEATAFLRQHLRTG